MNLNTVASGTAAGPPFPPSRIARPRRSGSGMVHTMAETTRPGRPTSRNAICQLFSVPRIGSVVGGMLCRKWTITPPTTSDSPVPAMKPKLITAMARGSLVGGNRSESIE